MENYTVTILSEAFFDLEEIQTFIQNDNADKANEYVNSILESISNLSEFPLLGKEVPKAIIPFGNFRKIIVDNYYVFYQIENNEILIYRILHAKRKLKNIIKYL